MLDVPERDMRLSDCTCLECCRVSCAVVRDETGHPGRSQKVNHVSAAKWQIEVDQDTTERKVKE
jgi:hypothetical protein